LESAGLAKKHLALVYRTIENFVVGLDHLLDGLGL
jgi:hypothetical protein